MGDYGPTLRIYPRVMNAPHLCATPITSLSSVGSVNVGKLARN